MATKLRCHATVLTDLLNYALNPHSTFLPEKLTDFKLVKKFLAFCGTRWFITKFTSTRLLPLS